MLFDFFIPLSAKTYTFESISGKLLWEALAELREALGELWEGLEELWEALYGRVEPVCIPCALHVALFAPARPSCRGCTAMSHKASEARTLLCKLVSSCHS